MNAFEKIKERLEEKIEITWKHDYMGGRKDAFVDAIEIVNQVAEEYSNSDGWILCSERLPKSDISEAYYQAVILTLDTGRVAVGCYINECNEWWADSESGKHYHEDVTEHVIAWQPLPTPYRPKGE